MRTILLWGGVLAAAALLSSARADVVITGADGNPVAPAHATKTYNPLTGAWDVVLHALYAPSGDTVYDVHGNGGEIIDNLVIDVPCWEAPDGSCMAAGSPVTVRVLSDAPLGLRTVYNILQTGSAETILANVTVTEDLGAVEVEAIGVVEVGRDVLGPIVATTTGNVERGISSLTVQRDLHGDVLASDGRISLLVVYGSAGSAAEPIRIEAREDLLHVVVVEDCFAAVNSRANGGSGRIYRFRTGTFHGSIETRGLRNNPFNGNLPRIWAFDDFEGTITIGGGFANANHLIELPTLGLRGQIIINADADPAGAWTAPVLIGPDSSPQQIVLSGPGYSVPASAIGGGSIGLVPFALHDESCDPPNGAVLPVDSSTGPAVRLRHYGPVQLVGGQPIAVARRPLGSTGPFLPIPSLGFAVTPVADDPNSVRVAAAPAFAGFEAGYEYELTPTAQLVCDVASAPPVVWDEPYRVGIEAALCVGDLDGSGQVSLTDAKLMLASWGPVASGHPADLDGDLIVGILDLLQMLANWGPCD